jgi:hypothetical protein
VFHSGERLAERGTRSALQETSTGARRYSFVPVRTVTATRSSVVSRTERSFRPRGRTVTSAAFQMPLSLPNDELRAALREIGLGDRCHERRALRTIIHECLGTPPNDHQDADALARRVLMLRRAGLLGPVDPVRWGC